MKNISSLFKLSLLAMVSGGVTVANAVDIATVPLWSSTMADVKPNVLFVLDDSGSMASDFLPDDAGTWRANDFPYCFGPLCGFAYGQFGRRSPQCNGVAFDPAKTYALPVNADGTTKPDATDADLRSLFAPWGAAGSTVAPAVATLVSSSSAITSGKLTLKVSAPPVGVSYFPSQVVTMYDATVSSRYSSGIVDSVSVDSKGVRTIVINVVYGHGDGGSIASGNARLALGTPNGALIYTYSGSQPKLNFEYTTSSVVTTSTFYTECGYGYDSVEGQKVFKPLILSMNYAPSGDSEDAKAKDKAVLVAYWRWFKYYRTRMLTMQSAVSLAFKPLDDRYRVGFTTILSKSVTSGMLDVADFNATQKADFYKSLYASVPDKSTPLRGAVMKAGRYFAKQMPGQTYDPVQYSCQRNYLILSTDGYWNTWEEDSASYTALNVTGSALVGHQDSGLKRPYNDGGSETTKVTTTWTRTNTSKRTTETPIKADYRRDVTATTVSKTYVAGKGKCKSGLLPWKETITTQVDTDTYTKSRSMRTDTYDVTQVRNYTQVTTTVNGTATVGEETFTDGAEKLVRSGETVWVESAESMTTTKGEPVVTSNEPVCKASRPSDVPPTTTPGDTGWLLVPPSSETTPYPPGSVAKVTDGPVTSELSAKVPVTEFTRTGGTPNTLADLAYYYYKTDLRSPELKNCTGAMGVDVCENNVPAGGLEDWATHQHMVFYGLSLGAGNSLKYRKDYMTATSGDFYNIKNGLPAISPKEWPTPEANTVTAVDDLWHAAVNGRGLYFSANNPESLSDGLASALSDITKVSGTAAAAATSTLQPIKGENGLYMAQFTSPDWVGDLKKYEFDATGRVVTVVYDDAGKVVKDAFVWSAAAKLTTAYTRRIFYFRPTADKATGTLGNFNSTGTDALTADELTLFAGACSKTDVSARLFQCAGADSGKLTTLNSAANMVSYLRGQPVTGMRSRAQILGDVVNSSPVFVGKPSFSYKENGYPAWAAEKPQVDRTRILLVGGNDGMLHAFKDSDGTEAWAYVPRLVMDKMYKLADDNYRFKHQYFVDGTVTVADVWDPTGGPVGASGPSGTWRTIVVGGLGAGGRGFYALDITDTDNPKALWELGPDQMPSGASGQLGLSMGNPIVTKRADGSWIVALTSGYNNPTAGGYLFIVNALTGEVVKTLPTEVDGSNVGEGLTKINAWVESTSANLALRFYGGDLKGQLWRFDVDNLVEPKGKALLLASFKSGESPRVVQPITTMPMLAEFAANGATRRVIYVGTGKYLGEPDVPSTTYPEHQQSIYAVVDELTSTGLGDVRGTTGALVQQTIDKSVSPYVVGSTSTPVDWSKNKGWFVDLGLVKERVNIDMMMVANTLVAVGNVPGASSTLCSAPDANSAYLYMFNIMTGSGKVLATGSMVAGLSATEDPPVDGVPSGTISGLITTTKSEIVQPAISVMTLSGQKPHRTSWRELY